MLDELRSKGEDAMRSVSPGTAGNEHSGNLRQQVVQHPMNAQVVETEGAGSAAIGYWQEWPRARKGKGVLWGRESPGAGEEGLWKWRG